ncbi:MAG TPA: hypothetical protein VFV19_10905 [Candidatus Polarisedimenticolaceae bacterium]|nr:hypothetical protein [Candidatus Polarisedimenticolaceae bacterium]
MSSLALAALLSLCLGGVAGTDATTWATIQASIAATEARDA